MADEGNVEEHFDEYEHYNYDQEKAMMSGHSGEFCNHWCVVKKVIIFFPGKQRTKKEADQNTNRHNPGGHERKIMTKLMNMEKNQKAVNAADSKGKAWLQVQKYFCLV